MTQHSPPRSRLSPLAKKVLDYLQEKGDASGRDAMLDLGINSGSFSRRITEIRDVGYVVRSEWRSHPITGRRYTRYHYGLTA